MSKNICLSILMALTCATSLFAQGPTAMQSVAVEEMDALRLLEQNALLALIGAVVLMGLLWICSVVHECSQLNKRRDNGSKAFMSTLILAAGLSMFGSSCTAAQQARAADLRAAQAVEGRTCPMHQHHNDQADAAFNNRSASNGYSNWYGPSFCKYCDQRISSVRR